MAELEQKQEELKQPTLTEIEQRAQDQGWRPKDEWDGDPEAWRPAKEFLDRGELFKKIDDQNRTIKEIRKALDDLSKHHSKVAEAEYKRALESLKAQKKEALLEQDADKVVDIDERIQVVRDAQKNAVPVQVPQAPAELNPIFVSWKDRNSWYEHNEAMRAYADRIGNSLTGMSPSELLAEVERRVKKEFAHKFENAQRNKPSAVEGSTNKGTKREEKFQLTDEQRRVAQRFIKTIPGYTMEKYVEELKKVSDL
jgi:hypothetical protein